MEDQEVRHLLVTEGKQLIGVVSDRDLREYRLPIMEEIDNPDFADGMLETPISKVMNSNLVTLDPAQSVKAAIDLMLEYSVGALPVVERHRDELVGIVSYVDVLRYLRSGLD